MAVLTVADECDANGARNASRVLYCYFQLCMTVKGVLGRLAVEHHFSLSRIEEIFGFHLFSLSNTAFDVQSVQYHFSLIHCNMIFDVADLY